MLTAGSAANERLSYIGNQYSETNKWIGLGKARIDENLRVGNVLQQIWLENRWITVKSEGNPCQSRGAFS